MSTRKDGQARGKYTLEIKFEAVRLVKGERAVPMTAKILGVPVQTLNNGVRFSEKGQLKGAGDKPVSTEQMAGGTSKRIGDEALLVHIKAIHTEVKEEYGWRKMCKQLLAQVNSRIQVKRFSYQ